MIDRDNRDRLADLLERLLRAEIPFERYERELGEARFETSDDRGVTMVCHAADSLSEEAEAQPGDHLSPERFSPELLRNVRRSVHFLRSDREFEWPTMEPRRSRLATGLEAWGTIGIIVIPLADLWLFAPNSNGVFACVLAVVNCAASWTASKRLQRRIAEEEGSRLTENRDFAAWPYARVADVPPELRAGVTPAADPGN
jgi:hypothetical protein